LTGPGGNVSYQKDGRLRGTVSAYVASSAGSTAVAARCVSLDLSGRPNIKTDTDHNPANGCQ
jgi:hypothetical protein